MWRSGRHFVVAGPEGRHYALTWDSADSCPAGSSIVRECATHEEAMEASEDLNGVADVMNS